MVDRRIAELGRMLVTATIVVSLAVLPRASGRSNAGPMAAPTTVLLAGRILDPISGSYSGASAIVVEGTRIQRVMPRDAYRRSPGDSVIDLGDATVLPGLIDGHVHLTIGAGGIGANALADLRAGFTTVVDLGSRGLRFLAIRDSINRGEIFGPRVLAAGVWVGAKNGVCEFNGIGIAGGVEEFRARIRANAEAGAEIAKLCVSGWPADAFARPLELELTPEILKASVEEAHARRQIAVAHDISLGGVRAAQRAGIDGFAHAAYLDSAAVRQMVEARQFMIPTLASLTAGDTSAVARGLYESVRMAHRMGVRLVFGTDGGVLPHGRNAEEFAAMSRAGVSALDAIRAATVNAAAAFRLQDSVGLVRAAMVADLIAVRGDPLADPGVLSAPSFVMSRGRIVR